MNREDTVIIFKNKEGKLRCKLCVAPLNFVSAGSFCFNTKFGEHGLRCDGYHASQTIQGRCFDNTTDEIILTESMCKLCPECSGMDNCKYNIKKCIINYIRQIKEGKVKHQYDRR